MSDEPKGKLKLDKVKVDQKSDIAIYVDIYLSDENGKQYKLHAASFMFDLEKVKRRKSRA